MREVWGYTLSSDTLNYQVAASVRVSLKMTSQNTLFLWTDFCDFYGVRIFTREQRKTQKDFLQSVLDKIVVRPHHNKDKTKQIGHSLDFTFKLKIVDDELEHYNENKKSKGYKIIEQKRIGKSADSSNFSTLRNRTKKV